MKMPFGKHKGKPLVEVPKSYLRWLKENCELREPLATAVDDELFEEPTMTVKEQAAVRFGGL